MRFFIELSYNGKNFHGWQIQKNSTTVEGTLEYCLSKLLKQSINIIGAGRTDAGVHAKQMFAHFDYFNTNIINKNFVKRLNIFLPKTIKILRIFPVQQNAHARFNANKRTYKYYISYEKDPFNQDFHWHYFYKLDYNKMNIAAKKLIYYNNFSSFCKQQKNNNISNICNIYKSFWTFNNNILCFTIQSNRFLRSMVRYIVGTLIQIGRNKITVDDFVNIIKYKRFNNNISIVPACGLFLEKINYPDNVLI